MQKWSWVLLLAGYACGSVGVTLSQPLQGSYSASTSSGATGTSTGGTSTTTGGLGTTSTGGVTSGGGGSGGTSSGGSTGSACTPDTWTNYIQSVFVNNCNSCHGTEFSYAGVVADSQVQPQVSSGDMPRGFALPADTKTRLLTWITCGMPQ